MASLPLIGLRRELVEEARELTALIAYVGDMARWTTQPSDVDVCHWLDGLWEVVARVESRATLLRCICDELRDRAISQSLREHRTVTCPTCEGEGEIRFNLSNDPQNEDYSRCADCGGTGVLDGDELDRVLRRRVAGDRDGRPLVSE